MTNQSWQGTTHGNGAMHRGLIAVLRYTHPIITYTGAALFVVPFYILFNRSGRICYRRYRRVFGFSLWRSIWLTICCHNRFAQALIDRFSMYAGRRFKITVEGQEIYDKFASRPEGFVIFSSHMGNYELAGYSLCAATKPLNAVVFGREVESIMSNRRKVFAPNGIKMIPTRDDLSHLFEINSALDRGEIVSFPADRSGGSSKSYEVTIAGHSVALPAGPFTTTTTKRCNAIVINVIKTGLTRYHIHVVQSEYDRTAPARSAAKQLAECYAKEIDRLLKLYPGQWFNFFPFWDIEKSQSK